MIYLNISNHLNNKTFRFNKVSMLIVFLIFNFIKVFPIRIGVKNDY